MSFSVLSLVFCGFGFAGWRLGLLGPVFGFVWFGFSDACIVGALDLPYLFAFMIWVAL